MCHAHPRGAGDVLVRRFRRAPLDNVGGDGFVAVAPVQHRTVAPDCAPTRRRQLLLAGHRVPRFRPADGRAARPRILRSDTDRTLMALGGNLLTHYNYHRCRASAS
jgi:hypothetical protein